ncbi:PREDICTED: Avr9/Cf-9 rapidly [Prunus dulcis]|uniref:PREDICTED: Avr9/Cf-9 rapidly n=1 Tax=Prunus dulcis TaxID=3755 RepID=A0A5E4E3V3_PRUDU|nr:uncharacterized protein LOC117634440 [Prunus dulcis]VVA10494.1 PREDICTED: Avr9/Cf-9 rapidly [Prunus dulcis]
MEVEPSPPMVAKKLWNLLRIVFFMVRKGLSKSKLLVDLHLMLKRGKLAGKAMAHNLMLHHSSGFSCRSNDAVSFITPREYEFSCSNSPAIHNPFHFNKRNKHHHHYFTKTTRAYQYDDVTTMTAVQKVLEMLNNEMVAEASPLVTLPGFGKSPMVRQLRITDSPFPLKEEGDSQVDKEAEEFINRFYKDLKLQKRSAVLESPSYHAMRGR